MAGVRIPPGTGILRVEAGEGHNCYNVGANCAGAVPVRSNREILELTNVAMSSEDRIAVNCTGCGQVFHVAPPKEDQPAKCKLCGQEFVIAAKVVGRRVISRASLHRPRVAPQIHAGKNRLAGASMAVKSARIRRPNEPGDWRSNWKRRLIVIPAVVLLVIGVTSAMVVSSRDSTKNAARPFQDLTRGRIAKLSAPRSDFEFRSISDLIEALEPAIVQVNTPRGLGSGFVVDPSGLIVTCRHCIEDVGIAKVVFANKLEAEVIGVRAMRAESDLAILQVRTEEPLPALALTDFPPKKGEPVVAFGSPAGLSFTVSEGSVSALRTFGDLVDLEERLRGKDEVGMSTPCNLIQFTATTMPGNSGGPVVDYRGNVIGISAFHLGYRGHSYEFAISYTEIEALAKYLDEVATPLDELWEDE